MLLWIYIISIVLCFLFLAGVVWVIVTDKNRDKEDKELIFIIFVLALVPILNTLIFIIVSFYFIKELIDYKIKNANENRENNKFYTCNSCEMIVRKGYIKENVCPACEEKSAFTQYNEEYEPSKELFFQQKYNTKTKKKETEEDLKQRTKQQEEKYLEIAKNKLKRKNNKDITD